MVSNYLRIALRSLSRRPTYALVNVFGLTVSLACCFLIALYVQHELSYDRYHEQAERIVRLAEEYTEEGQVLERSSSVPLPLGPALAAAYGLEVVRVYRPFQKRPLVRYEDRQFYESRFYFADPGFFRLFDHVFLRGDPATALTAPDAVVLTASAARRYFGGADPLGRTLSFENAHPLRVTAVVADPPTNTHLPFDFVASLEPTETIVATAGIPELVELWQGWYWNPAHTYVRLPDGLTRAGFEEMLPGFVRTYLPEHMHAAVEYHTQALPEIHLTSHLENELTVNGSLGTVQFFALIAAIILLIACINFTNLSTARSLQRAKEVGMRKVLGAYRGQLVFQLLGEAMLMAAAAAVLAALLALALLPAFGGLLGAPLDRAVWLTPWFFGAVVAITFVVGMLAGLYPAFVLSSFAPVRALRGDHGTATGTARLRQVLVIVQFTVSIVLLVGTFVVERQLRYMQTKDLGFDREQVVMIPIQNTPIKADTEPFKEELRRLPGVRQASAVSDVVGRGAAIHGFKFEGVDRVRDVAGIFADMDFTETLGIELVEGRGYDAARGTDEKGCLLNESLARDLGWTGSAAGRRLETSRANLVLGVMRDFHFAPVRESVRPLIVCYAPTFFDYVAVRLAAGHPAETLARLEAAWHRFVPDRPFEAFFLDQDLDLLYRSEQRLGQAFGLFSGLAVLIACLGLLGLAAFTAERRTKEIGVRKVLGASVSSLVLLLSGEFLKLVALSFVVAVPVAYVVMQAWLGHFAYRVGLSWWLFAAAGAAAVAIAFVTITTQTFRAARSNPIDTLRCE